MNTEKLLESLNDQQQEAVTYEGGPLLVLAGAGSGKTRVLSHRIAYFISKKNIDPNNILAVTFTNKAAQEMRERITKLITNHQSLITNHPTVSTFHSFCAKILRIDGEAI